MTKFGTINQCRPSWNYTVVWPYLWRSVKMTVIAHLYYFWSEVITWVTTNFFITRITVELRFDTDRKSTVVIIKQQDCDNQFFDTHKVSSRRQKMPGLERVNKFGRILERKREGFVIFYLKCCPTLFHLCYDPIGTHKKIRATIGFFIGLFMGVFFYEAMIIDLQFDAFTSLSLGALVITMLSIGCASSIQVNKLFQDKYEAFSVKSATFY